MKAEIFENEGLFEVTLKPESIEEYSQLLRYGRNASAAKPEVFVSFHNDPYCQIILKKKRYPHSENSIKPDLK